MTQEAMRKIVDQRGREGVYALMQTACAKLEKNVFLRYCMEAFGNAELEKMAQRMMVESVAELNVLIDLLTETCMTVRERYELICTEDYYCKTMIDDVCGGDTQ